MDDLCMEDDNVALYVDKFVAAAQVEFLSPSLPLSLPPSLSLSLSLSLTLSLSLALRQVGRNGSALLALYSTLISLY
jgi:hypothetical protein